MGMNKHMEEAADPVRIVSRRTIQPRSPRAPEDIHLTPWDLCLLTIDYIQKGLLLPKPADPVDDLVDALASSLALALDRFYPLAGRLVVDHHHQVPDDDGKMSITVLLRCAGQGAELVHATAPGAAAMDIVGSVHTPSSLVWALFPLNQVVGADAAVESLPLLSAQVTELADGVFVGVSMNHSAGDGTAFWEFFNAWSEINRRGNEMSSRRPVQQQRWFTGTSPVPIAMPFSKLQHVVQRFQRPAAVAECFFTFSGASIKKLKARANDEIEMAGGAGAIIISSLQALLAHLWRAVCRARLARPEQETSYSMLVGCRGRVTGIPEDYMGNAVTFGKARSTAGEIMGNGLGWAALQLNRVVASFDEASVREWLGRWAADPRFVYNGEVSSGGTALATGSSPRFDVFGNDFGWGKPVAVRSGSGNKIDGKATVFQGPEEQGEGSMSLEVCVAPDVLDRLVNDLEFMDAVSVPT
ncbi:uncharacterized acetyltransferase At3g50280 [Brachypodium distachyon]|uniref:Acetyltransferase n=1 Tax=Brachypodium distachyon TaxID=15368 RepID=I1HEF2_BRADI|nr:uncharacterized acetyltransferase At3g50280 [Brachypodium distachyon]KQK03871.1 hypothetical protein BRADI_2g10330v3 [Brachypodium distachyon]|eukprot:XP_003566996.2 uncharacterized acetyltransferase At3g50280 [Brachypodium distachyon]